MYSCSMSKRIWLKFQSYNRFGVLRLYIIWISIALAIIVLFGLLAAFTAANERLRLKSPYPRNESNELYFYSLYHYPYSKSLGKNAVALVMAGSRDMVDPQKTLRLKSGDQVIDAPIEQVSMFKNCEWITLAAFASFENQIESLSVYTGSKYAVVPVQQAQTEQRDVVVCISPLFANDHWQLSILAIHTYKHYGAHMHVYIRSMIEPLYRLYKEYEQKGILSIQGYPRVEVGTSSMNPNSKVEFRNQAAEQTDCLLQYKEVTQFITFLDLDDVLIPRHGSNYLQEFNYLFNDKPNAAYIAYVKNDAYMTTTKFGQDFVLADTMRTIGLNKTGDTGKFVIRPSTINHTWIHWPRVLPKGMAGENIPYYVNSIIHLKDVRAESTLPEKSDELPIFNARQNETLSDPLFESAAIKEMSQRFESFKQSETMQSFLKRMPTDFFYHDIIKACFQYIIALLHEAKLACPHMEICTIRQDFGTPCFNAKTSHVSIEGDYLNLHFRTQDRFELNSTCDV